MIKENWNKITEKKMEGIDIPQGIDFYKNTDENKLKVHINFPQNNMQDDKAAFEAWALIFYTKKNRDIILRFKPINWGGSLVMSSGEHPNYMRFLYRVWKFNEQMKWFSIEEESQNIINEFETEFLKYKIQKQLINNRPQKEAEVSKGAKSEHFFENTFVRVAQANKILKDIVEKEDGTMLVDIYNQLPNGLFKGNCQKDIKEANRIFPTGYFDMWGISKENELCIFELKVSDSKGEDANNKSVGIISELFFYANYSKDIFMDKNCCHSKTETEYRGYDKLLSSSKEGIPKIKAYFLAPMYHSRIEDNMDGIERCLNNNTLQIEYRFLKYNYDKIKPLVNEFKESYGKKSEVVKNG